MAGRMLQVVEQKPETAEEILADVMRPEVLPAAALVEKAADLAARTAGCIQRDENPAFLASVTAAIPDQRLKLAFLEEIGGRLMR